MSKLYSNKQIDSESIQLSNRNKKAWGNRFASLMTAVTIAFVPLSIAEVKNPTAPKIVVEPVNSAPTSAHLVTATVHHNKSGNKFLYSGGGASQLDSFIVSDEGELTPLKSYTLWKEKGPARGLVTSTIAGTDYLFVGNKFGNAVEVHRIHNDGTLTRVHLEEDTEETHLGIVITLQVIKMNSVPYLFVGGLEKTPGLTSFRIKDDGSLVHVQSMPDNDMIFTDGIIGMTTHKIGDSTYLVTGGFQDSGISSFKVWDNGQFENVSNIADDLDYFLNGVYPVDGITLGNNHYVVVGHRHHSYYKRGNFIKNQDFVYHGNGVSVFKMGNDGSLNLHYVLRDGPDVNIKGQTRIAIQKIDDKNAIVAIGTRDGKSIQVCILSQDGVLEPTSTFPLSYEIYNGMTSSKIKGEHYLFAGPVGDSHMNSYKLNIKQ